MKKGFTLIELLAVIVILAIIVSIALPIVINIIKDTKESSILRSGEMYLKAVEMSVANRSLNGAKVEAGTYNIIEKGNICLKYDEEEKCIDILKVETKGKVPTSGTVTINGGKINDVELVLENKVIIKNKKGALVFNTKSLKHEGVIPKGGVYYVGVTSDTVGDYTGATATYNAGNSFPETINVGDVYVYGDYEYRYKKVKTSSSWSNSSNEGWGVAVIETTKEEYGEILESINKIDITSLSCAFYNCKSLIKAPVIPSGVTNMQYTFYNCGALTKAPVIPSGVTSLYSTFSNCSSLKTYEESEDEDGDFSNYILPSGLTSIYSTFYNCTSLTKAPIIPSRIRSMEKTFSNCSKLTKAPVIPSGVTNMQYTFQGCSALTGIVEINADPTSYSSCFNGTSKPITLTGTSTMLETIASEYSNVIVGE